MKEMGAAADDLVLLVEVVEAGGFSAASARCGIPKSRLSRRIARLEQQLGMPLIKRDSRHFEVTDLGRQLLEHGARIRESASSALTVAQDSRGQPTGDLRVACPVALATALLARFAAGFVQRYPLVRLSVVTTTGRVESLAERYDIVVHPSSVPLADTSMVARPMLVSRFVLVSAPGAVEPVEDPRALSQRNVIGWDYMGASDRWRLTHEDGRSVDVAVSPRLSSDNLLVLREAVLAGWGVAPMATLMCAADVAAGRLQIVAPGWAPPPAQLYAVYGSRRTLSTAGRAFVAEFEGFLREVYGLG